MFPVEDHYYFSEYFDHQDLFEELSDYYDHDAYRFEVPVDDFDADRDLLAEFYCVVKEQYTEHAEILKQSVLHWEREGHMFFLLNSPLAVDQAVGQGATRLDDTEFVLGL